MAAKGHGTSRIVLVQRPREVRSPQMTPIPGDEPPPRPAAGGTGWTIHRLMLGASLGGVATLLGGILFKQNFTLLTGSRGPLLAIAFGLFVIGLVVFFGCLIGLAAGAIRILADRRGWMATALVLLAPACVVFALWGAGAYGFMYPALFTLLVSGGALLAIRR